MPAPFSCSGEDLCPEHCPVLFCLGEQKHLRQVKGQGNDYQQISPFSQLVSALGLAYIYNFIFYPGSALQGCHGGNS